MGSQSNVDVSACMPVVYVLALRQIGRIGRRKIMDA